MLPERLGHDAEHGAAVEAEAAVGAVEDFEIAEKGATAQERVKLGPGGTGRCREGDAGGVEGHGSEQDSAPAGGEAAALTRAAPSLPNGSPGGRMRFGRAGGVAAADEGYGGGWRAGHHGRASLLLKALAAEYRAALRGFEWDGSFDAAGRADGAGLGTRDAGGGGPAARGTGGADALSLARFAALGIVLELFVEEKDLFAGGEDELTAAVSTDEDTIAELHMELPLTERSRARVKQDGSVSRWRAGSTGSRGGDDLGQSLIRTPSRAMLARDGG